MELDVLQNVRSREAAVAIPQCGAGKGRWCGHREGLSFICSWPRAHADRPGDSGTFLLRAECAECEGIIFNRDI